MTESNSEKWDYFYDQFDRNKWYDDGVAELQRIYMKNGQPIYKHIGDTDHDLDLVPYIISARGVSAFLADESLTSFRYSLDKCGLNYGVGSQQFYKEYFGRRKQILRQKDNNSTVFEDERMSDYKLIKAHLKEEQQLFKKSESLFYSEEVLKDNLPIRDFIKKAALKYLDWVKKTHLEEDQRISKESDKRELKEGSGIFVPKINEEIINDLYVKLSSYFEPQEQFMNFLTGKPIEGKINFMAKQNKLAGIFIDLKLNEDITLGTHQQTFDFIKHTFLIKGKPIESNQIFTYLKDPSIAHPKNFIDISI